MVAERASVSAEAPMTVESIIDFIENGDIDAAREAVERQIELNGAISAEGLAHSWGAEVGRTLLGARAADVAWSCSRPRRSRFRCAYERLRATGGYRMRIGQSGHHLRAPRYGICRVLALRP